jgi:copper resistance protein B
MMRILAIAALIADAASASAQHAGHEANMHAAERASQLAPIAPSCSPEHEKMGHCARPSTVPPAPAVPRPAISSGTRLSGPEHAADTVWGAEAMAPVRAAVYSEHGSMRTGKLLLDRLEYRAMKGRNGYRWDGEGWYGGDYDRLWIKSEGEGSFGARPEFAELQALWSHAIDPWFNFQTGIRYDIRPRPHRAHLVVGVQGLAPYFFEIDTALFLSDRGDLTARMEAEYDQRITNQLILQPRVEMEIAAQNVRSAGIGAGLSSIEAGVRLRYEIVPEFAPYLGVEYQRSLGKTADFSRAAGNDVSGIAFVAGVRAWF